MIIRVPRISHLIYVCTYYRMTHVILQLVIPYPIPRQCNVIHIILTLNACIENNIPFFSEDETSSIYQFCAKRIVTNIAKKLPALSCKLNMKPCHIGSLNGKQ